MLNYVSLTLFLASLAVVDAFTVPSFGVALPKQPAVGISPSSSFSKGLTEMSMSATTSRRWRPPAEDKARDEGLEYLGEADGVRATRTFAEGEVVVHGFRIKDEGKINHSHASQVALDQWVQHGGIQSFLNHACYPASNCHPRQRIDEDGILVHDMVALREIPAGTTVTFDYCLRNLFIQHFAPKCLCGGANCRGQIRGWAALGAEDRDIMRPFAVPYLELWEETVEVKQ